MSFTNPLNTVAVATQNSYSVRLETIVPFLELTDEQWTRLVDVNLRGAWLCSQVFCQRALAEAALPSEI